MASIFPSPDLVKQWQQQYNKLYTVSDNYSRTIQESVLAHYAEQLTKSSSSFDKAFSKSLSWDKYQFSAQVIPTSADKYFSKLFQGHAYIHAYTQKNTVIGLLAQALCPQPVTLQVPAKNTIQNTLVLDLSCCVTQLGNNQYGISVEHSKLYIEPEAQVTLMLSSTSAAYTALIKYCEITLGAYAQVTIILDDTFDKSAYLLSHISWYLKERARLTIMHSSTGANTALTQMSYFLQGQHAEVNHVSLYALTGDTYSVLATEQHHYAPYTTSSVQVKQVVRDTARVYYTGLIALDRQARESVAEQSHAALLVSAQARAFAVPALEIHTKEVRCRHASAIGAITPEYIWALQLRGLEYSQAQELIIEGFLRR